MPVSELFAAKFGRRFETLDVRRRGFVEWTDYDAYVNRLADAAGRDHAAPEIQRLRELYRALWTDMAERAEADRLSRDEYV